MSDRRALPVEAEALSGRIEAGVHRLWQRVYYEDTDAAGIVYYGNYLRLAERARTEMLRCLGVAQGEMRAETGLVFVVRHCAVDYRKPARLDDLLEIRTCLSGMTRVQMTVTQEVRRASDDTVLAEVTVRVVCVDEQGRPARIPPALTAAMNPLFAVEE